VPTLSVWTFPTPYGAEEGELRVKVLRDKGALVVHDLATVVWFADQEKPHVRQPTHMRGSSAAGGAVLGTAIGALFLVPVAGAAIGLAAGTVTRRLRASGITDDFIAGIKKRLRPGTSAVLLLASDVDLDLVRSTFPEGEASLSYTDLPPDAEQSLRELMEDRRSPGSGDASSDTPD
jgi:uncharacterized membrane protein